MTTPPALEDRLSALGDHIDPPSGLWHKVDALIGVELTHEAPTGENQQRDARPTRRIRRVLGGVAVGATLGIAGVAAAAAFGPGLDHDKADQLVESYESHTDVHLDGWRPELNAEHVRCIYADGRPQADTVASEFPLEERMTTQHLIDECRSGNDAARMLDALPAGKTILCSETPVLPSPVVAIGFATCEDAGYDDVGDPEQFLERLHQRRAFELAMKTPDDRCMDHDAAERWLGGGLAQAPEALTQTNEFDNPSGPCWNVWFMWDQGLIFLQPGSPLDG